MWSRIQLKENAKRILERNYWMNLVVCLVATLLTSGWFLPRIGKQGFFRILDWRHMRLNFHFNFHSLRRWVPDFLHPWAPLVVGWSVAIAIFSLFVGVLYLLFVVGPIQVGLKRHFIVSRNSRGDFIKLLSPFFERGYANIVRTMGGMFLRIWLWSLLLVLPGFYMAYCYRQVPFILAENPAIPPARALQISREMMRGEKLKTLVLDISFLGWYLLGTMACGVGILFVLPYLQATFTELYGVLRYKAITTGICHATELSGGAI